MIVLITRCLLWARGCGSLPLSTLQLKCPSCEGNHEEMQVYGKDGSHFPQQLWDVAVSRPICLSVIGLYPITGVSSNLTPHYTYLIYLSL